MTSDFTIHAIEPTAVQQLLISDDADRSPILSQDDEGGAPLRCCLRYSEPGERIALLSYAPLSRWAAEAGIDPGPYNERGPVFIHADACPGQQEGVVYRPTRRVFRAYDHRGNILGGQLAEKGHDPHAVLTEMFADPKVAVVHARAVEFGCFFYEARRASWRAQVRTGGSVRYSGARPRV